jgi:hypothetical protein
MKPGCNLRGLPLALALGVACWVGVALCACRLWPAPVPGHALFTCETRAGLSALLDGPRECEALQVAEDQALLAHASVGIEGGMDRLRGVELRVAPFGDGGSFVTPDDPRTFGWARDACPGAREPRIIWLASFRWDGPQPPPLCHELAHVRRGCIGGDDGRLGAFAYMRLDEVCR